MNLYWPVYKNLEREVIMLSNQVHFDDKQLSIYSIKISELLIRCAVEIEAISKDLFLREGGEQPDKRDLYFDTDCLQLLEDKWLLSKKKITVSAVNFYFRNDENKILTPLLKASKRGTSSCDWKKAYQDVKHNRTQNLEKGNIKNVLRALGALFILNIYFKNEIYTYKAVNMTNFPINMGSDIFSIKIHKGTHDENLKHTKNKDFDECIYMTKLKDDFVEKYQTVYEEDKKMEKELFLTSPKFLKYLETNKIQDYKGENLKLDVLGWEDYIKLINIAYEKSSNLLKNDVVYEAVPNKNNI